MQDLFRGIARRCRSAARLARAEGVGALLVLLVDRVHSSMAPSRSCPVDLTPALYRPGPFVEATPTVTVVVTSHNRAALLPVALRSVQMQSFQQWECVVVDDASADGAVGVARSFLIADQRFRIVEHPRCRGLAAARNSGIAAAHGRFLCFLDDDDFLLRDSIERRLNSLAASPSDVAGAFCDWVNTDPEVGLEEFDRRRTAKVRGTVTFASLRHGTPFIATAPLLRASVLRLVGGFDESFRRAEDAELWVRILRLGFRFVDAGHVGVAYRRSPQSMVLTDPAAQLRTLTEVANRADQPTEAEAIGPSPVQESLADLSLAANRAPTIYRYLALMAIQDPAAAATEGRSLLPPSVRHEIDVERLSRELAAHVLARCSVKDPSERAHVNRSARQLVAALVPPSSPWSVPDESS